MIDECYIGDCREGLREFAESGQRARMCVTSPPYWGLRDYGIPPSVWDDDLTCPHEWGDELSIHKGGPTGSSSGLTNRGANQARSRVADIRAGKFCQHCGAWLGVLGLEPTPQMFVQHMVEVCRLIRECLTDDGTLWLNLGDSYASGGNGGHQERRHSFHGHTPRNGADLEGVRKNPPPSLKPKDLCMMPARVAIALQEDGWYLRQEIIWHKPASMPESIKDRFTRAHESVFLLAKNQRYYFDQDAVKEPCSPDDVRAGRKLAELSSGTKNNASFDKAMAVMPAMRNRRSVWTIAAEPYSEAHFATFPRRLVEPCILAGSEPGDVVLDPFMGSGTSAQVAEALGRHWYGCELNSDYVRFQRDRLSQRNLGL